MSDRRHTPRPTLPEGYQYGDAKQRTVAEMLGMDLDEFMLTYGVEELARISPRTAWVHFGYIKAGSSPITMADGSSISDCWRAPHENAAAQLKRQVDGFDIAGDVTRIDRIQRTGEETI